MVNKVFSKLNLLTDCYLHVINRYELKDVIDNMLSRSFFNLCTKVYCDLYQ
jgi:hypothetical protein